VQVIDEQQLYTPIKKRNHYPGPQIVYRCFGKRKQWWHYFVTTKTSLEFRIQQVKEFKADAAYVERVKQRKANKQKSNFYSGI
jgi:hypothetical protein